MRCHVIVIDEFMSIGNEWDEAFFRVLGENVSWVATLKFALA
jgi:hypothetical protein